MSYTCPRCGATSQNPSDERERYCGRCKRFEADDELMAEVAAYFTAVDETVDAITDEQIEERLRALLAAEGLLPPLERHEDMSYAKLMLRERAGSVAGPVVIRIMGMLGRETPFDGQWLTEYDPTRPGTDPSTGEPMRAHLVTTPDKSQALRFDGWAEAHALWRKDTGHTRPDGEPDRPLTAFNICIEPADDDAPVTVLDGLCNCGHDHDEHADGGGDCRSLDSYGIACAAKAEEGTSRGHEFPVEDFTQNGIRLLSIDEIRDLLGASGDTAGRPGRARMIEHEDSRIRRVAMPARIAALPRNAVGYPIPWFVATLEDGTRDFRIAGAELMITAIQRQLCWVCGQPLGAYVAFVIGPMCAVNRISAEPPAHRDCAIYSATVCPFLSNPTMRRREIDVDQPTIAPGGNPILRNPGVALVWITRSYQVFPAPAGNDGILFHLGEPTETAWFALGRKATRAMVIESLEEGLPLLQAACKQDENPAESLAELDDDYRRALTLVPRM